VDVEFEEVVHGIGERDCAVLRCGDAVPEAERLRGFIACVEGYVLEIASGVCHLWLRGQCLPTGCRMMDSVVRTCSPVSIVLLRHVTGIESPYLHVDSANAPLRDTKNR
jgi:hypothetical protein